MLEIKELCSICQKENASAHAEVLPGFSIHVCGACIKSTQDNFISICMNCGQVYVELKERVIRRTKDLELKKFYMLARDMRTIQGKDMCVACEPQEISIRHAVSQKIATC